MQAEYLLFDLDGTLTDPGEGITNSVAYALKRYGIDVEDRTTLYRFIGPPLSESFEAFYGFSKEESVKAVSVYREYYSDRGIWENVCYDGIASLLQRLSESGKKLVLATSKPEEFAKKILAHFSLDTYFTEIVGSTFDGSLVHKADVIAEAMRRQPQMNAQNAVMIGDREYDILGAKTHGMHSIGVLYGYGSRDELASAGADTIAESVKELSQILE